MAHVQFPPSVSAAGMASAAAQTTQSPIIHLCFMITHTPFVLRRVYAGSFEFMQLRPCPLPPSRLRQKSASCKLYFQKYSIFCRFLQEM